MLYVRLLLRGLWKLKHLSVPLRRYPPSPSVWHPTHPRDSIQFWARCRFKISPRRGCLIVGSCPLPPSLPHTLTRLFYPAGQRLLPSGHASFSIPPSCTSSRPSTAIFILLDSVEWAWVLHFLVISSIQVGHIGSKMDVGQSYIRLVWCMGLALETPSVMLTWGLTHGVRLTFLLLEGQMVHCGSLGFPGHKNTGFHEVYYEPRRPFPT